MSIRLFPQIEPTVQEYTNSLGYVVLADFIGQRWTNTGPSEFTNATISCGYDSTSNSTNVTLDPNRFVNCVLPLENQPPFLMWTSPAQSSVFSSNSQVLFDANDSWDLDDDPLTFSWSSSLDGDILASCTGQGDLSGVRVLERRSPSIRTTPGLASFRMGYM